MAEPSSISKAVLSVTGPMLIANLLNWGLFGTLTVQLYIYYISFPDDPKIRKYLVTGVYLFEIVQTVMTCNDAFKLFASGWGNPAVVDDAGLLWFYVPVITESIACATQLFYAWRVHAISRNRVLTGIICTICTSEIAFSIWNAVAVKRDDHFTAFPSTIIFPSTISCLASNAACDVIITLSMFYYLFRAKRSSPIKRTNVMISRLIQITVETGFVTAASAVTGLILFIVARHSLISSIFIGLSCKLYSNCLMAVLNARVRVVGGRAMDANTAISMSVFNNSSSVSGPTTRGGVNLRRTNGSQNGIAIAISKATHSDAQTVTMGDTNEFNSKSSASLAEPLPENVYDRA